MVHGVRKKASLRRPVLGVLPRAGWAFAVAAFAFYEVVREAAVAAEG